MQKPRFFLLCFLSLNVWLFQCAKSDQENSSSVDDTIHQASDFTPEGEFTSGIEGPATDKDGNTYVVNYDDEGTIGIVSPEGISSLFVNLPLKSVGNGIRIDKKGYLYIADYPQHNVLKLDPSTKTVSIHSHDSNMNQPNDLAIASNGTLFASDPNWADSTGNLWRIDLDGSTHLLEVNMGTTNGIEISPKEELLYVNESVQRNIWVYDLAPDFTISNKRLLMQFPDYGMDGMRCDQMGNLYVTRYGKGTVAVVSPEGKLLAEVSLTGAKPSNISFGGPDGKTCYVTLQDRGCLETFRAEYPGRSWNWIE